LEIDIRPTRKIVILGLDRREPENLGFCAATFGASRLFWVNGRLLCLEVYEKSFEYEIKRGVFYVGQLCYADFPKYSMFLEIRRGMQIPIVNASDMQLYKKVAEAITRLESKHKRSSHMGVNDKPGE